MRPAPPPAARRPTVSPSMRVGAAQHPAGRPGVPAPAAAALVARAEIDVGRLLVRRQPIDVEQLRARLADRRDLVPDLERAGAQVRRPARRRRRRGPCRPAPPGRRPARTSRASTGRHSRARPADSRRSARAPAATARRTRASAAAPDAPSPGRTARASTRLQPAHEVDRARQYRPGAHQRVEPGDRVAVAGDQPREPVLVPHAVQLLAQPRGAATP